MIQMKKPYNGNKIQGYNLWCWNCGRGLIDGNKFATTKLIEAREFIKQKKLHILYLIESDLNKASHSSDDMTTESSFQSCGANTGCRGY